MDIKEKLSAGFAAVFNTSCEAFYSAPGRTEIGGNHTDHQHGKVLAAAVDLDTAAGVRPNGENIIRVYSEGYGFMEISLDCLEPVEAERGSTGALIRGVAAGIKELGHSPVGFDAYICSTVLPGSGLSSSAAFEVLIGTILNDLGQCGLSPVEIARIGQYSENVFFGKPCGLMDQTASSVGNIITIDFADTQKPVVTALDVDFSSFGHSLCIIDSGADHADLTAEYAAIPGELHTLCSAFGKNVVREVPEDEFYARIPELRRLAGDRAVLRAIHIYDDNRRVDGQVEALKNGDFDRFLALVKESGLSSWLMLQNVVPTGNTRRQELAVALALAEKLLCGRGACRVHGGGFAGTLQAFVPNDMLHSFKTGMEAYLGEGRCHVLNIRREGGVRL